MYLIKEFLAGNSKYSWNRADKNLLFLGELLLFLQTTRDNLNNPNLQEKIGKIILDQEEEKNRFTLTNVQVWREKGRGRMHLLNYQLLKKNRYFFLVYVDVVTF